MALESSNIYIFLNFLVGILSRVTDPTSEKKSTIQLHNVEGLLVLTQSEIAVSSLLSDETEDALAK